MERIFVGISGWTNDGWRGNFYPEHVKRKDELAFASRQVSSIEVNGTFHTLFKPASFLAWYDQTPSDFAFAIKGPKYITHVRRIKDFETPLCNFFASGVLGLKEKLGPILWQLPPTLKFDAGRVDAFLGALPRDMQQAAQLGAGHSTWLEGRAYLEVAKNAPLRHALEVHHPSYLCTEFVEVARRNGVAIVVGDTAGRWPYFEDRTADFVYVRLHGDESKYPDGYTKDALEHWGSRFRAWATRGNPTDPVLIDDTVETKEKAVPVFAYFDNDVKEMAGLNALSMMAHLNQVGAVA